MKTGLILFLCLITLLSVFAADQKQVMPIPYEKRKALSDAELWNMLTLLGMQEDSVKYIMSLPTSPPIDWEAGKIIPKQKYLALKPDGTKGIVFTSCDSLGVTVFEIRSKQ